MPETPEGVEKVMAAWKAWFADMGEAVVDVRNPLGMSKTVSASGVANDGGSNPLSGYSLVNAADIDAAVELAKGCPALPQGTVEVAEAHEM
jgi:hypothetical protein